MTTIKQVKQFWEHDGCPHPVILRCTVGSSVHGLSIDGTDDRDEMGVCVESMDAAMGIKAPFEQYIFRSAAQREGKHDAPSAPGDLDLTIYSLRKWCRLALDGNPTVLVLLFSKPLGVSEYGLNAWGWELQKMAQGFASRRAGARFLGYLQAQRQRLLGERGQKNVNRQKLVDQYGYDTKYAGHMLRLGYQGVEFMETGRLTLPMPEVYRSRVMDVRLGRVDINDVLTEVGEVELRLKGLLTTSPLPESPDTNRVEQWMLDTYFEFWT